MDEVAAASAAVEGAGDSKEDDSSDEDFSQKMALKMARTAAEQAASEVMNKFREFRKDSGVVKDRSAIKGGQFKCSLSTFEIQSYK